MLKGCDIMFKKSSNFYILLDFLSFLNYNYIRNVPVG